MARFDQDTVTDDYASPWLQQQPDALNAGTIAPTPAPAPTPTAAPSPEPVPGWGDSPTSPAAPTAPTSPTAPSGGYQFDMGPQASPTSDPQLGDPGGDVGASAYQTLLESIRGASDPTTLARSRDALARQLQADLEADGHKVTWKGETMLIDGRAYEVGGDVVGMPGHAVESFTDGTFGGSTSLGAGIPWDVGADHPSSNPDGYIWDGSQARFVPAPPPMSGGGQQTAEQVVDDWFNTINVRGHQDKKVWIDYLKKAGVTPGNIEFFKQRFLEDPNDNPHSPQNQPGRGGSTTLNYAMPDIPAWLRAWSPSAPTYTPGSIDTELKDLPDFDEIYKLASGNDESEKDTEALIRGILEHPESLSDRDVEMLKAHNAEEAAVAGQLQDEELQHFGANTGLDTSPWLAGQRAQNAWDRREATIGSNRTVDIAAANTRGADRARAAQLGTSYNAYRSSKAQAVTNLAVEAALGKAGEQRSRTALNEAFKQAATQLGLSRDQLVVSYIQGNMDFVTKQMGFDVDLRKLAQQSDEFKQQLAQRIAEVKQADEQFQANYGLAAQEFGERKTQNAWERAKAAAGLGV